MRRRSHRTIYDLYRYDLYRVKQAITPITQGYRELSVNFNATHALLVDTLERARCEQDREARCCSQRSIWRLRTNDPARLETT